MIKYDDELNTLISIIHSAFSQGYGTEILTLLLTADERQALTTRVRIISSLLAGTMNQRKLKDELGIGIATITRGSNSLKEISPEFKAWLESMLTQNQE